MNVEYSYYGKNPCLIIKGTEFIKSFNNDEELYLLEVAVDGAFGDAGPMCNIFDKRGRKTFCFKFVECCIENASAAVFRFFSHMRCPVSSTPASCREGSAVY